MTRPETIPRVSSGTHRVLPFASGRHRLGGVSALVLRANRNGRIRVRRESAGPAMDFFFLVRPQTDPLSAGYASHNKSHNPAGSEQGCQFREIDKTCSGYL
jgi:hypothetical protein